MSNVFDIRTRRQVGYDRRLVDRRRGRSGRLYEVDPRMTSDEIARGIDARNKRDLMGGLKDAVMIILAISMIVFAVMGAASVFTR